MIGDAERIRRVDDDALHSIDDLNGLKDFDEVPSGSLAANPGFGDEFDEGPRAAVQDREFEVVDFHDRVIHFQAGQGRQEMFGSGYQYAFLH